MNIFVQESQSKLQCLICQGFSSPPPCKPGPHLDQVACKVEGGVYDVFLQAPGFTEAGGEERAEGSLTGMLPL